MDNYLAFGIFIGSAVYTGLNLFVRSTILKAHYLNEERRKLHLIFIWILPFLGPLLIYGFWKKRKIEKLDIHTRSSRKPISNGNHGGEGIHGSHIAGDGGF